jgi:hypothetical protein
MLCRYTTVDGRGFTVFDAEDAVAIYRWALEWSDLLEFDITPVLDDVAVQQALAGLKPVAG